MPRTKDEMIAMGREVLRQPTFKLENRRQIIKAKVGDTNLKIFDDLQ